jgi:hypothetical protein
MSTEEKTSNSLALTVYPEVKKHDSLLLAEFLCTLDKIAQYEPVILSIVGLDQVITLEKFLPLVVQIKIHQYNYKSFKVTNVVDGREFFKYDMPLFVQNENTLKVGVFGKMMEKMTKEKQKKSLKLEGLKENHSASFIEAFEKVEHHLHERAASKTELFEMLNVFINSSQLPEDQPSTSFYSSKPTSSFFDGSLNLEIGYVPNIGYSFTITGATFKDADLKDSVIAKLRSYSDKEFFSEETYKLLSSNGIISLDFSNIANMESLENILNFLFNDE